MLELEDVELDMEQLDTLGKVALECRGGGSSTQLPLTACLCC